MRSSLSLSPLSLLWISNKYDKYDKYDKSNQPISSSCSSREKKTINHQSDHCSVVNARANVIVKVWVKGPAAAENEAALLLALNGNLVALGASLTFGSHFHICRLQQLKIVGSHVAVDKRGTGRVRAVGRRSMDCVQVEEDGVSSPTINRHGRLEAIAFARRQPQVRGCVNVRNVASLVRARHHIQRPVIQRNLVMKTDRGRKRKQT